MWFYFHTQITPTDLILQNDAYFNTEGVFDSDWRSADSIWSLVSDEMLSGVLEEVSKLKKSRKLDAFYKYMIRIGQLQDRRLSASHVKHSELKYSSFPMPWNSFGNNFSKSYIK